MDEVNLDLTYTEVMKLIYSYKRHTVLWDAKTRGYKSKSDREDAWILVATQSGINKEVCKKKMKSLSSAARREKIRLSKATEEGKSEEPKWRYWNDLKFLRGIGDNEDDPLGTAPEMDILDPKTAPNWLKERVAAKRKATSAVGNTSSNAEDIQLNSEPVENTFGCMAAAKLKRMSREQRIYAENIINQIIYKGLLGNLTKHCDIS